MSGEPGDDGERLRLFAEHRSYLVGVAYRMLGSVAEAEDVVQDTFLRWQRAEAETIEHPRAYLARIVTRLCLDRLKSAQLRREQYVGTWLPEPLVEAASAERVADDLSIALLMTLERLSPLERAAFLLHDVFDMDYGEISGVLDRTEPAVRQLAARARDHVRENGQGVRPRFTPNRDAEARLMGAFAVAASTGDVKVLASILAKDAVLYSDGGGKRRAALNPIYGADRITRFLEGVARKGERPTVAAAYQPARINGLPGLVIHGDAGPETIAFETDGEQIIAIYIVRNPDKLKHLS
ncbi:MAG: sigma-70 family RNA polymerase sigma factor [Kofleriaceae bacterium]